MTCEAEALSICAVLTRYFCMYDEVLLHVRGERVKAERAAGPVGQHHAERAPVLRQLAEGAGFLPVAALLRFRQGAPQVECDEGQDRTDEEGDAPTKAAELIGRHHGLQQDKEERGQELAANERDVLEGGE